MTLSALGIFSAAGAGGVPQFGIGAGYTVGGLIQPFDYITTVDKFNLTNDTRSTLGTGLPVSNALQGCVSDVSKGFVARGLRQFYRNQVYKFTFSTDTFILLVPTYAGERHFMAGAASTTKGYFMGGSDNAGNQYSGVDTIDLAAETLSSLGTGLSSARGGGVGLQSSSSAYAAGGETANDSAPVSTVDKFAFSNDARTTLGTGLNTAADYGGSISSSSAGYIFGGFSTRTAQTNIIQKITFATDSPSTISATLSVAKDGAAGFGNAIAGYAAGGNPSGTYTSTVEKLIFSVETMSTLATGLSGARHLAGFLSNKG